MIEKLCKEYGVNKEQAEALDIHSNIALRAGAGSGKTRVLTNRYLRLLSEAVDVDIDQIVAITFTRKAASEMKERIRQEISKRIEKSQREEESRRWNKLRILITSANIDTIHGFCGKMLRDNFEVLGLDPYFEVMEEADSRTKLFEYAKKVINEFLESTANDKAVKSIASVYGSDLFISGDLLNGLINLYKSIREKGLSVEDVYGIMTQEAFASGDEEYCEEAVNNLERAALKMVISLDGKYVEFKQKENLLDFNDMEILADRLLSNDEIKMRYLERYRYFLVDEFQDVNPIQKRILYKLCLKEGKLPGGRLFIVGDHKQSIYGFRGTDYRIFNEVCDVIGERGNKNLSNCYRSTKCIIDTVNSIFAKLIEPYEWLNYPGERDEKEAKVELILWDDKELQIEKSTRWDFIKKLLPDDSKTDELIKALRARETGVANITKGDYQGDIIAGRIKRLAEQEGIAYKNIAILMRSRTGLKSIENSLSNNGIPYCVLGGIGFWGRQEIVDIIALYKLVFDSDDIISLLTVLRSPIFGFSDDMIFRLIRIYRGSKNINMLKALGKLEAELSGMDAWLASRACRILEKVSKCDGIKNAYELMKLLCYETSYPDMLLSLPEGTHKYRNLEKLMNIIRSFEQKGIFSPMELPEYLAVMEENSGMDSEAFLDTEDSDAVKILTIHASKGLEFDAVIIPDMHRAIDGISKRNKPLFYFSEEKGVVAIGIDEEVKRNSEVNPLYVEEYKNMLKRENEDSRRVFYVAATRAKKYLGFVGTDQKVPENGDPMELNSFMKQLKWAMDMNSGVDTITILNGTDLICGSKAEDEYPPNHIKSCFEYIDKVKDDTVEGDYRMLEPVKTNPKGNISISMFMKYLDCPRSFYFRYIAGIKPYEDEGYSPDSDDTVDEEGTQNAVNAAQKGSIVHGILENLRLSDSSNDSIERCIASAEAQIAEGGDTCSVIAEDIRRYVRNYVDIEKEMIPARKGRLVKSLHELGFRVSLCSSFNLIGAIDRIDIYENEGNLEAYIIDFKTNKIRCDEDMKNKAEYYRRQICAYIKAVQSVPVINGRKADIKGAYLYFLDCGKFWSYSIQEIDTEGLINELEENSSMLLERHLLEEYRKNDGDSCAWCDYANICSLI